MVMPVITVAAAPLGNPEDTLAKLKEKTGFGRTARGASEAAHVNRNVRQYLDDLERDNPLEPELPQQDKVSTTDPDAAYFSQGDRASKLGYFDNYLMDNASCVIVGLKQQLQVRVTK